MWDKVPRFRLFLWKFNVVNALVFLGKVWGGIWSGCCNSSYKQHTQEFRSVASRQHPWQGTQQTKWGIKSCSTSRMCFQPTGMGSAERAIWYTRTVQELYRYVTGRWGWQLLSHIFRIIHCKTLILSSTVQTQSVQMDNYVSTKQVSILLSITQFHFGAIMWWKV